MKYCFTLFLFVFAASIAEGQKLPKVQKEFQRPPVNLKIDGKASEWGSFQAFNPNIQVFYTLANDENNLYLAIKSTNPGITSKIMRGGITLSIKSLPGAPSVTFPIPEKEGLRMLLAMTSGVKDQQTGQGQTEKQMDSVMFSLNRKTIDKLKEAKISGLKGIPDSVISIYNDLGIQCRSLLDKETNYIYELSIPLKYLDFAFQASQKLDYEIKLNGVISSLKYMPNPNSIIGGRDSGGIDLKAAASTTYCSGEYILSSGK